MNSSKQQKKTLFNRTFAWNLTTHTMNSEEIMFDNLLDTSVDGNVFLEDLIEDPQHSVLEQAMKENMVSVLSKL